MFKKTKEEQKEFEFRLFLAAFNPSATSKDAHHILVYGCTEPGSQKKIW
jgi:hypothetical protein